MSISLSFLNYRQVVLGVVSGVSCLRRLGAVPDDQVPD
jgi:hypothetical protein